MNHSGTIKRPTRSLPQRTSEKDDHEERAPKDRLLCELEWQQTLLNERIRVLEKRCGESDQFQNCFKTFYRQSPVGYISLTPKGHIVDVNPVAAALFGLPLERLMHLPFSLLVFKGDTQRFSAHLAECQETAEKSVTTELRLRARANEPARVQLISITVAADCNGTLLTVVLDMSHRIRNERALAEVTEFSENIVETVSQPLAVLDSELRIISVNRAFTQFFRKPAEYIHGRVIEVMLNLWWSGNALREELERLLVTDGALENFQVEVDLRGLGRRALLLNARRLIGKSSASTRILIAVEDITVRKRAEEQLIDLNQELEKRVAHRTEALKKSYEQMELFCYSIAHDLRAPLRSMNGFSSILMEQYGENLDAAGRDFANRINESAERMDRLICDLLDYGRLNTAHLKIQKVNLNESFQAVMESQKEEINRRHAKITRHGTLPNVGGHPTVIQAVLANLISNAMKFVAPGVRAVVSISSETRGLFERVWVNDNGIGIAPENREKIFGVFQRLHSERLYPGTGIGLAIVCKGVERMGGRAGVESELSKGSRFWIDLPKPPGH